MRLRRIIILEVLDEGRVIRADVIRAVFHGREVETHVSDQFFSSAKYAIDAQRWPDVACERCRELHAGKRINKPVTKVGKNP